ncbi:hypothetical protein ACQKWADRAFT_149796 [Trichoderma austrokoningii]
MVGLSRALALLALGTAVRASPFFSANGANGTITQPPTTTTPPPSSTDLVNVTCGTMSNFPGIILSEYQGLSTSHDLQCQCLEQAVSWLAITDSPTRTFFRTFGTGVTTLTETITSGTAVTTTVITTALNSVDTEIITGNFLNAATNVWYGSATSPCCYSCTIGASTVEVFYFADQTSVSSGFAPVTSFVSNGYTFQSPSVYIGFSSLSAIDFCGLVGQPFTNITVGFDPGELSTILFAPETSQTDTHLDLTTGGGTITDTETLTFFTPIGSAALNTKDLERNCSTIQGYTYIPGNPSNIINSSPDPCHPTIVIPDRIRSLDPAWASCISDGFGGFYDPPSALSSVTALVPSSALPGGSGSGSASSPSGTPGGGNNGGGNGGGNGGSGNGGSSGGNGGSNGGGNTSGSGSGSGSPPNGSNDNSGSGSSNGNGSSGSGNGNGGSNGGSNGSGSGNGNNGSGNDSGNGGGAADSSTSPQNTGNGVPPTSVISVGSLAFSENSQSEFVHGSTTLVPGGPAVTVGSNILSLPTSGSEIIVNGSTEPASGSESSAAGVTGAPGSQETSGGSSGNSDSTNTASSGLPSSSVTRSGAAGLLSGVMTNIRIVGAAMLVAFYIY